jgi:hypothetical protein
VRGHGGERTASRVEDLLPDHAGGGGGAYLMAVCSGIKRDGGRCTATVEPPQGYCWWHDPANADKRKRAASRGGRGRGAPNSRT